MLRRKGTAGASESWGTWSHSPWSVPNPPTQRKQVSGEEGVEWNRTWRSRIPQIPGVVSGNNGGAREIAQESHCVYDTSFLPGLLRILKPYSLRLNC